MCVSLHFPHACVINTIQVSWQTLSDRAKGIHISWKEAYEKWRLLSNLENVLLLWCDHMAITAKPMDPVTLHGHALLIKGVHPRKHWHQCFIKQHSELKLGKASGLNLNQANNFNEATMKHYFQLHQELEAKVRWNPTRASIEHGWERYSVRCRAKI